MDLGFLCVVGSVVAMGAIIVVGLRFRWKTVNYMREKIHNPSLEPPSDVKIGNRIIRFLGLVFMMGVGGSLLYWYISTRQLIAASIVGLFLILATVIIISVGSYWKDKFDL